MQDPQTERKEALFIVFVTRLFRPSRAEGGRGGVKGGGRRRGTGGPKRSRGRSFLRVYAERELRTREAAVASCPAFEFGDRADRFIRPCKHGCVLKLDFAAFDTHARRRSSSSFRPAELSANAFSMALSGASEEQGLRETMYAEVTCH